MIPAAQNDSIDGRLPRRALLRGVLLVALAVGPGFASALEGGSRVGRNDPGDQGVDEYTLKAAYLEKFHKYVEWPEAVFEDGKAPFVLAIFGKDPFEERIDKILKGKSHGTHPVKVVRVKEDVEELAGAHIVFVTDRKKAEIAAITKQLAGKHVLIVGESKDLAQKGAIVNFYLADTNVRFEVNPQAAKRAGLKISSSLLKLARIVEDPE